MTDELVKRLRGDWCGYEVSLKAIDAMTEAADRIEQLTAERDGLLRCVTDNHVALCRAEAAEAERDRLRRAMEKLACKCSSNCDWEHEDVCPSWIARAALKGESHE